MRQTTNAKWWLVLVVVLGLFLLQTSVVHADCFGLGPGTNISSIELLDPANQTITGVTGDEVDFTFRWYEANGQTVTTPCRVQIASGVKVLGGEAELKTSGVSSVSNLNEGNIEPPDDEGVYSWSIQCCDNSSGSDQILPSAWREITFDFSAPATTLTNPADNDVFGTTETIDFNFTPVDTYDDGPYTCTLIIDGSSYLGDNDFMNNTPASISTSGFTAGTHNWTIACTDQYTNTNSTVASRNFIIDATAPDVTLNAPASNTYVAAGSPALYNFTAVENLGTNDMSCELIINDSVQNTSSTVTNNTATTFTAVMDEGTFSWSVNCTDEYLNEAASSSRTIHYDGSGPTITLLSPADEYAEEDNTTAVFNYSLSDEYSNGSFTCDLIIDASVQNTTTSTNATNDSLSYTFSEDGTYTWSINCTDVYGNTGSSTERDIIIDIAPVPPTLWNLLSVVGDSILQLIGYIDKYGVINATVQNDDNLISNTNGTQTFDYPNDTTSMGSFPITAVAPTFFTVSDPTNEFENLSVGRYVSFSSHNKSYFEYYRINYIDASTVNIRKINLTPSLEQQVSVGDTMYIYDRAVPTGWFNFTIELFPGTNNVSVWGSHLGITGEVASQLVYLDNTGPEMNTSSVPTVTNLNDPLWFLITDDSAINFSTLHINASNGTYLESYLYNENSSYNTSEWTLAENISCSALNATHYNCTVHPTLPDGTYTFTFNAADTTDHTTITNETVVVKTTVLPVGTIWHVDNRSTTLDLRLEVYWTPSSDPYLDHYELSVSSLPIDNGGSDDIVSWFSINSSLTSYIITNDTLAYGNIYYVNIRPLDTTANVGNASSTELIYTLDPSPPTKHEVRIIPDKGNWLRVNTSMNVTWNFTDNETGVAAYEYAAGTTPATDLGGWNTLVPKTLVAASSKPSILTDIALEEGEHYYLSVRAKNGYPYASLWSSWYSSSPVTVDSLAPTGGWLMYDTGSTVVDVLNITYAVGNDTGMGQYNVSGLEYAVLKNKEATLYDGVCGSFTDWQTINASMYLGNPATYNHQLDNGKCYRFSLWVYDFAGNKKEYEYLTIRNVSVDVTAPGGVSIYNVPTVIYESTLSFDWSDAVDNESGIEHYECALGTASSGPDISDTLGWHNCSTTSSATLFNLTLSNAEIYYFSVRAVNSFGLKGPVSTSYGMLYFDIYPPANSTVTSVGNDVDATDGWMDTDNSTNDTFINFTNEAALDCVWSTYDVGYVTGVSYTTDCNGTNTSGSYYCLLQDFAEGEYTVHIACQDTNGNEQTEATNTDLTFIRELDPPVINITYPHGDDEIIPAELTSFTVSITDASDIVTANYTLENTLTSTLLSSGDLIDQSEDLFTTVYDFVGEGGEMLLTVNAVDTFGRQTQETRSFLVNQDQPFLVILLNDSQGTIESFDSSHYYSGENFTLQVTAYFFEDFMYTISNASGTVPGYNLTNSSATLRNKSTFVIPVNISDFTTGDYTFWVFAQRNETQSYLLTKTLVIDPQAPQLVDGSLEREPSGVVYENDTIRFFSVWEDNSELSTIIFSHNATGNWTNITAQQTVPRDWRPDESRFEASILPASLEAATNLSYTWYGQDAVGNYNQTAEYELFITNRNPTITTTNISAGLAGEPYFQTTAFVDSDSSQTEFNCTLNTTATLPNLSIDFLPGTHTCLLDWPSPTPGNHSLALTVFDLKDGTILSNDTQTLLLQVVSSDYYNLTMDVNNYPLTVSFATDSDYNPSSFVSADANIAKLLPNETSFNVTFSRELLAVSAFNLSASDDTTFFFRKNYTTIYYAADQIGNGLRYEPLQVYALSLNITPPAARTYEVSFNYSSLGIRDEQADDLVIFKYPYDEPTETINYTGASGYGLQTTRIDTTRQLATLQFTNFSAFVLTNDTQAPSCNDGILNQDETGVDCGGVCPPCPISPGGGGSSGGGGFGSLPEPTCDDGIQNQNEVSIDCGGVCGPCETEETCFDGVKNQNETAVDCGGICGSCADSSTASQAPTCFDGIKNQDEVGIDCGGVCRSCAQTVTGDTSKQTRPVDVQQPNPPTSDEGGIPTFLWIVLGVIVLGLVGLLFLRGNELFVRKELISKDEQAFDEEVVSVAHYIAKQRRSGFDDQRIKTHLTSHGFARPTVEIALSALSENAHRQAIVEYLGTYEKQGYQLDELQSWLLEQGVDRALLALAAHEFRNGPLDSPSHYAEMSEQSFSNEKEASSSKHVDESSTDPYSSAEQPEPEDDTSPPAS